MASCIECGASIEWRDGPEGRMAFDSHPSMRGDHRYAEVNGRMVPVRSTADILAYTDHRTSCAAARRSSR